MDSTTRIGDNNNARYKRPIRNKRYNRRGFSEEKRPPKRLFTPEIKRFLKDWLVRRRENPYPNRDEKKMLAIQTGLTYIQVCNWFANWRRKLKNAGKEPQQKTWGDLIKTYNRQVQGNVEHFSICSDDSIWEETATTRIINSHYEDDEEDEDEDEKIDHAYTFQQFHNNNDYFKNNNNNCEINGDDKPAMITRWLESAANFKPNENSYIDWMFQKTNTINKKKKLKKIEQVCHDREELDAAEALTTLANARISYEM